MLTVSSTNWSAGMPWQKDDDTTPVKAIYSEMIS
jgi:hypothetical protein